MGVNIRSIDHVSEQMSIDKEVIQWLAIIAVVLHIIAGTVTCFGACFVHKHKDKLYFAKRGAWLLMTHLTLQGLLSGLIRPLQINDRLNIVSQSFVNESLLHFIVGVIVSAQLLSVLGRFIYHYYNIVVTQTVQRSLPSIDATTDICDHLDLNHHNHNDNDNINSEKNGTKNRRNGRNSNAPCPPPSPASGGARDEQLGVHVHDVHHRRQSTQKWAYWLLALWCVWCVVLFFNTFEFDFDFDFLNVAIDIDENTRHQIRRMMYIVLDAIIVLVIIYLNYKGKIFHFKDELNIRNEYKIYCKLLLVEIVFDLVPVLIVNHVIDVKSSEFDSYLALYGYGVQLFVFSCAAYVLTFWIRNSNETSAIGTTGTATGTDSNNIDNGNNGANGDSINNNGAKYNVEDLSQLFIKFEYLYLQGNDNANDIYNIYNDNDEKEDENDLRRKLYNGVISEYNAFKNFLTKQFCLENLLFWIEVLQFKEILNNNNFNFKNSMNSALVKNEKDNDQCDCDIGADNGDGGACDVKGARSRAQVGYMSVWDASQYQLYSKIDDRYIASHYIKLTDMNKTIQSMFNQNNNDNNGNNNNYSYVLAFKSFFNYIFDTFIERDKAILEINISGQLRDDLTKYYKILNNMDNNNGDNIDSSLELVNLIWILISCAAMDTYEMMVISYVRFKSVNCNAIN